MKRVFEQIEKHKWWLMPLPVLLVIFSLFRLPDPVFDDAYSTVIESMEGDLLGARIAGDGQWRFPPGDSVPEQFKQCVLVYEDAYFYRHPGVNPVSLFKAFTANIKAGKIVRGGSTLTMQVIRMAYGNRPRTYLQKALEIILALKLELFYTKEEILQLYVYHAPFGGNVVGLNAASWRYFGRPADRLSWGEAAVLAVLPNSPSLIFPGKNQLLLKVRRDRLLQKLYERGIIDETTFRLAREEPTPLKPKTLPRLAPRLLTRAIGDGYEGKRVKTTIRKDLQLLIREKVKWYHAMLEANEVHNLAVLVIDLGTGAALAYAGNADAGQAHAEDVDMITANRSTGSLLKPVLYAAAIDEGLILPAQLLPDIPVYYQGFAPKNFDKKFHGSVPADEALARSLNVPFVYLLKKYGYEKFYQKLQDLGFRSMKEPPGHYGLSMILGGAESSLWDLTALYAGLARELFRYDRRKGNKRYSKGDFFDNCYVSDSVERGTGQLNDRAAIEAPAVWQMLKAMQQLRRPDELASWKIFKSAQPIAWKTGTSFGFRDAWAIGINSGYVVGIWAGNADGEGRPGLTGVRAAAPVLFDVFRALDGMARFPRPVAAMEEVEVCALSGYKAGPDCDIKRVVEAPASLKNTPVCPYHRVVQLDGEGGHQVNSSCYAVSEMKRVKWFVLPPVQAWYYKKFHPEYKEPPEYLAGCKDQTGGGNRFFELIYPRSSTRIYVPRELDGRPGKAVFEAAHRNPDAAIFWYVDDRFEGKTIKVHQIGLYPEKGKHMLYLIDNRGRELSAVFEVLNDRDRGNPAGDDGSE